MKRRASAFPALRILAGSARGRRLEVPDLPGLRPTSSRVREAIFSMAAASVPGARVLDLFAGTGSLGLEALSRGAASCTFIEKDFDVAEALSQNVARVTESLGAEGRVLVGDAAEAGALGRLLAGRQFDLLLLDPPYGAGLIPLALRSASAGGFVLPAGEAFAVHETRAMPEAPEGWLRLGPPRAHGDSAISRYEFSNPT